MYLPKKRNQLKLNLLIGVSLMSLITMTSCNKQHSLVDKKLNTENSSNSYARLKFSSIAEFKSTLKAIVSEDSFKINQLLDRNGVSEEFKSLNGSRFEFIKTNSTIKRSVFGHFRDYLVPDPYFAILLNQEREIAIENHIYKVTKYGTFKIDESLYKKAKNLIDSLDKSGAELEPGNRKFSFESSTETENLYQIEKGIYRFDTYKDVEIDKAGSEKTQPSIENNINVNFITPSISMQNQSTNPYGIPASEIKTVDYTNDKIFLNFSSNQRIRSNIHDYNWLINTYMEVELMAMIKGWTGAWRGLENVGGLAIHLNNLVVKRVLVPGAGADGYPSDGTYYFPNWTPVNSSSPTSITKGTVIVNGGYLTFNLFPNVVTANSGPTIYMGFIPLINAASGGTIDVLSIDLGCYGNSYGKWIGIEYKK